MKKSFIWLILAMNVCGTILKAQSVRPSIPIPSKRQLDWHDQEFYFFVHFGPNTFTDKEWGHGDEPEDIFNPTALDCRQWARIAKQAGAKAIIITAKHHDGFCLWPSQFSKHTVRESKWKNGRGDVLKDLARACSQYGLKFGVYVSPWDRNHPQYGTPQYNDVYVNTMREIFSNYSPIWEFWWDGANGEGPNGKKQVYDWRKFESTVRHISPNTVVFSDIGPDIRWVGNEKGIAGKTNWNMLDTAGFTRGHGSPHTDTLNQGNMNGKIWIPAECDVSIRPGWFYHANEDDKVKTPEQLFDLYLKSVGRGANFLLNVPPDRRGLFHEKDSASLVGFKKLLDKNFSLDLARKAEVQVGTAGNITATAKLNDSAFNTYELMSGRPGDYIRLTFKEPVDLNTVVVREMLQYGQRIQAFELVLTNGGDSTVVAGTTVGRKRIVTFPTRKVSSVSLKIVAAKAPAVINDIAIYRIDDALLEK